MYFRHHRLWITWSDHSVKTSVSEHALANNMWKCRKNLQTLHERTFFMCFHHFEWIWKVLAKSPWERFYHVFSSFRENFIYKISPLVLGKILGMFYNTLTADGKYPIQYWENLPLPIQMELSDKQNPFHNSLFHFWNLSRILNILKKKKIIVIANVFPKLQTVKIFDRPPCKKRRFGTRFDRQHVKVSHILAKSPWQHFHHVFLLFWDKLIWEMSPQLFHEILGAFLNTLTVDAKYPVDNWEILQFPMETQLSENRKTFSRLLFPFVESTSNFKYLEKR